MNGNLPRLLWCQHLGLCEEVEALLQGEVSRSGSLAQRAWILLILQLLGAHQDVLLQALVVLPHQLQGDVFREVQQSVLCGGGDETKLMCLTYKNLQATQ